MAKIDVRRLDHQTFEVIVSEGGSASTHRVVVSEEQISRLGRGVSAEELVEASFRFLLDREPKESILPEFDLVAIGRYFREYESTIEGYL